MIQYEEMWYAILNNERDTTNTHSGDLYGYNQSNPIVNLVRNKSSHKPKVLIIGSEETRFIQYNQ